MFIWSPFHYFYLSLYFFSLFLFLLGQTFIYLWVLIELMTLIFWSLLLISSTNNYSSSMVYFLFQSVASINILFWYLARFSYIATSLHTILYFISVSIKLGLAPFNIWYFTSMVYIPKLPIYLALTLQKLPPLYLLTWCPLSLIRVGFIDGVYFVLLISSLRSVYIAVVTSPSLISLILISSLLNTVWLVLSSFVSTLSQNPLLLYFYLVVYSLILFLVIFWSDSSFILTVRFYSLIGFPPFPLFFAKIRLVFSSLIFSTLVVSVPVITRLTFILFSNAILLILYFNFLRSHIKSIFNLSFILLVD